MQKMIRKISANFAVRALFMKEIYIWIKPENSDFDFDFNLKF